LPVGELVGQIGVTQKQLIAQFYRRVGCTPKLTSRIMRFQKLLAAINGSKSPDWAALAVDHGYYDQPHLIHEFQEFAGVTPSQYISQCTAHPDYLVVR
jgi:methylphosphotriester-DNA--protein-cysteine methyltransferase